jgi:ATP-binding cassette, subfamily C, bacterial
MLFNRELLEYSKDVKRDIAIAVVIKYAFFFLNLLFIYFSVFVLEAVLAKDLSDRAFAGHIIFISVLAVVIIVSRLYLNKKEAENSYNISTSVQTLLRKDIYRKIIELETKLVEKTGTSRIVSLAIEGVEMLEVYFSRYLPQFFYSISSPFILFIILVKFNVFSPLVMLFTVPFIPVSIVFFMKKAKKYMHDFRSQYEGLADRFLESIQGLTTLKLSNRDDDWAQSIKDDSEKFRKKTMKVLSIQLVSIFIMDFFSLFGAALGITVALYQFSNGNLTISGTIIILLLSSGFFLPVRMLGSLFHAGMNGVAAFENIHLFLKERGREKRQTGFKRLGKIKNISFDKVSFSYDGSRKVLKNVSFSVREGETIAIVGPSGSGKSTIGKLLLNFYDVDEGSISINGIDMKDVDFAELRNEISIVSQGNYVFNDTVRKNLLLGNESAGEQEIKEAIETSGLSEELSVLENGLDTTTGEWGGKFSGGQKQRIVLARTVLKKGSLMIFDEATSNVDAENEEKIWENLSNITSKTMSVIITHRLSVIKDVDKIIVLENGKVAESGAHFELMDKKGLYFRMYREQSEIEEGFR